MARISRVSLFVGCICLVGSSLVVAAPAQANPLLLLRVLLGLGARTAVRPVASRIATSRLATRSSTRALPSPATAAIRATRSSSDAPTDATSPAGSEIMPPPVFEMVALGDAEADVDSEASGAFVMEAIH